MATTHTGSWGTPEYGATEYLGNLLGSPTTAEGGSNIFGGSSAQTSGTGNADQLWNEGWNTGFNSGGAANTNTDPNFSSGYNTGWAEWQNRNPSGGGGGGGTSTTPTNPTQPGGGGGGDPLAALYSEIDNIYNTTMNYLGGQESTLRTNQPTVESDVQGQYAATQKGVETQKAEGERTLTTAGTEAGQRKEDALTAGRRLFGELQMGGQQRFGGASSAGQAYGELIGREFQRGQATTQQAYQNAMTKVSDLKANLQERFDSAMFNLETQKNNALNEVRRIFQERLSQIDSLKAEAGVNKSTMRLDLLQQLRNQVYQLNLASVQTQTQLNAQKTKADQELATVVNAVTSAQGGAQQATTNLIGATTTNPQTALNITGGGMGPTQQYTGRIKKDEMT